MTLLPVADPMGVVETLEATFHKFVQFPPEIRLMIWCFIAITPRNITFDWAIKKKGAPMVIEHTAKTVPAILYISHEARNTAFQQYEVYASSRLSIKPFYINFDVDTLMFGDWEAVQLFYAGLQEDQSSWPADLLVLEAKIKFLAFGGQQLSPCFENHLWVLWRFSNLKELMLVERKPGVQNNGGFWSRRRWDLHLRELDRAIKHLTSKNEGSKVHHITDEESWAMRVVEEVGFHP
ncbi:hypothetical protein N431DRAFT_443445 [Stipitochalara longipes BDJ]|nr:hypothetical protein N431DRAFT_443445 [Stipitochalara longipes BDJ]